MKTVILIIVCCVVFGCNDSNYTQRSYQKQTDNLITVTYDGCEYLTNGLGSANVVFVHKGNCKNHNK